jgi:tripartite-type tricarboxylate transporter receptor subunit TctC
MQNDNSWRRCDSLAAALAAAPALAGLPAHAQARLKLATITTGFAAGGSSDVTARIRFHPPGLTETRTC